MCLCVQACVHWQLHALYGIAHPEVVRWNQMAKSHINIFSLTQAVETKPNAKMNFMSLMMFCVWCLVFRSIYYFCSNGFWWYQIREKISWILQPLKSFSVYVCHQQLYCFRLLHKTLQQTTYELYSLMLKREEYTFSIVSFCNKLWCIGIFNLFFVCFLTKWKKNQSQK